MRGCYDASMTRMLNGLALLFRPFARLYDILELIIPLVIASAGLAAPYFEAHDLWSEGRPLLATALVVLATAPLYWILPWALRRERRPVVAGFSLVAIGLAYFVVAELFGFLRSTPPIFLDG